MASYYWNPSDWSITFEAKPGAVGIPTVAALLITPIMGALFLMFLPLIGFALVAYALSKKLASRFTKTAEEFSATVAPGWMPGEAHLTGKPGSEASGDVESESNLDALAQEIEAKRQRS